jgi:hypothetical protein
VVLLAGENDQMVACSVSMFHVVLLAGEHDQMVLFKMVYLQMVLFAECDLSQMVLVNNSVCGSVVYIWIGSIFQG